MPAVIVQDHRLELKTVCAVGLLSENSDCRLLAVRKLPSEWARRRAVSSTQCPFVTPFCIFVGASEIHCRPCALLSGTCHFATAHELVITLHACALATRGQ